MRKLLYLALVLCLSLPLYGQVQISIRRAAADGCGAYSPPSFELDEDFEGSTAETACDSGGTTVDYTTTSQNNIITDCDYTTTVLAGSESVQLDYGAGGTWIALHHSNATNDTAMSTMYRFETLSAGSGAGAVLAMDTNTICWIGNDGNEEWSVGGAGCTVATTGVSMVQDTTYWLQITRDRGNKQCCGYVVSTNPASGGWGSSTCCTHTGDANVGEWYISSGGANANVGVADEGRVLHSSDVSMIDGCEYE